jgi:hypothetical protein
MATLQATLLLTIEYPTLRHTTPYFWLCINLPVLRMLETNKRECEEGLFMKSKNQVSKVDAAGLKNLAAKSMRKLPHERKILCAEQVTRRYTNNEKSGEFK